MTGHTLADLLTHTGEVAEEEEEEVFKTKLLDFNFVIVQELLPPFVFTF